MDHFSCYTEKKQNIKNKKVSNLDDTKIIVVKTEIESWYLAGLNYHNSRSLRIPYYVNTENITKENFLSIMPDMYTSRINFMQEILKKYSLSVGKSQNKSLDYCCNKYL